MSEQIERLAEVVEATSTEFTSQCYNLFESAPLGALVKSGGGSPVFGVVHDIATLSIDPGRTTVAMGATAESVENIYDTNPQLGRLYSTRFRSLLVGYRDKGQLNRYLAPMPPKVHDHVYECQSEEIREFSNSLEFLSTLLKAPITSVDEVIASFLARASTTHTDPNQFLVESGKELATLLGGQLHRLNPLLKRLSL